MAGESDIDSEEDGNSIMQTLTILLDLAITVIEEAQDVAAAAVSDDRETQLARTEILH